MKIYKHNKVLKLEFGEQITNLEIAYHTYGKLNKARNNVVWVCHSLTANSDVKDWWPRTVESGRFLDPDKYYIVCANILGSVYGTTGAASINPLNGQPYNQNFPLISIRDMVSCHQILAQHLAIESFHALMGSSLGGFQAIEWAIKDPKICKNLILIATSYYASPWAIALNESQRMAIECDPTYGHNSKDAGSAGLECARSIALLSYRGQPAYNTTQQESSPNKNMKVIDFRAASYQRYQGRKLSSRFNAYSYHSITKAYDTHNVARDHNDVRDALSRISANVAIIAVNSDLLFPTSEHKFMADNINGAKYYEIDSQFGHDGFLIESDKLNKIILNHYN